MIKIILTILLLSSTLNALCQSQATFRINSLPANHPEDDPIFIAGSMNAWNPGDPEYQLSQNQDGTYEIAFSGTGTIAFKFTRGDWSKVEGDSEGGEIADRNFTFGTTDETVLIDIESWKDLEGTGGPTSTAAENVQIFGTIDIPQLGAANRRIWVYLPPDYESTNEDYPVIYMHDAQNIFDAATSFAGEWGVDETLNELFENTGFSVIVVGIDHGGSERINEYCPWVNAQYGGGKGANYVDFLVETLKPLIDSEFRTRSDRDNTAIIGSSLGGLISHYAALKYPETFSKVGALSPAFWVNPEIFEFTSESTIEVPIKLYMSAGSQEPSSVAENMNIIKTSMEEKGIDPDLLRTVVHPGYGHNEGYWKSIFEETITWLFESEEPQIPLTAQSKKIRYWAFNDTIHVEYPENQDQIEGYVYNLSGQLIKQFNFLKSGTLSIADLPNGVYLFSISGYQETLKFRKR